MDPDATLVWILRLRAALDADVDAGRAPDPDAVYTLVGLLEEIDAWLAAGRRPPRRWQPALAPAAVVPDGPLVLDAGSRASNDARPSRRHPPARRGARRASSAQLALPFAPAAG